MHMWKKILFLTSIFLSTHSLAATSYNLSPSSSRTITEFGVCKIVTSTASVTYIVPTGQANDWQTFLTKLPAGVTVANCAPVNCAGTWSACSKTCGGGTRSFTMTQAPSNGGWSDWGPLGSCSCPLDSLGGKKTQYRSCNNPPPSGGGAPCSGPSSQQESCTCPCKPSGSFFMTTGSTSCTDSNGTYNSGADTSTSYTSQSYPCCSKSYTTRTYTCSDNSKHYRRYCN